MTERRFTTPQRAFVRILVPEVHLDEAATHEEVMQAARRAWDDTANVARAMFALGVLDDRRELARASCAVARLTLARLTLEMPRPLMDALETVEAWVTGTAVTDEAMAHVVATANDWGHDDGPPGATALMALALRLVANVLDPDERFPETSAGGAAEVFADAWNESGLVDHPEDARRILLGEIRRVVSPWAALETSSRPIALPPDDPDYIPF